MLGPDYAAPVLRRWYVVLIGLVLTLGLAAAAARSAQPTYQAEATAVLLPGESTIPEGGNPFLYLGDLVQARDVVLQSLNSDAVKEEILGGRSDLDYLSVADILASGPMIVITTSAPSAEAALQLREEVLSALPVRLDTLQDEANTPTSARFEALTLSEDAKAVAEVRTQVRAVIAVGLLGLALSLLAAAAIDALARTRGEARGSRGLPRSPTSSDLDENAPSNAGLKAEPALSGDFVSVAEPGTSQPTPQ